MYIDFFYIVYKAAVKWPRDCKVDFRRENIWDEIKQEHRDIIARFARVEGPETKKEKKKGNSEEHFEYDEDEDEDEDDEEEEEDEGEDDKAEDRNWTRAWEGQSFITRTVIRQIGISHLYIFMLSIYYYLFALFVESNILC